MHQHGTRGSLALDRISLERASHAVRERIFARHASPYLVGEHILTGHPDAVGSGRTFQRERPGEAVLGTRRAHRLLDGEEDGGGGKQRRLADRFGRVHGTRVRRAPQQGDGQLERDVTEPWSHKTDAGERLGSGTSGRDSRGYA